MPRATFGIPLNPSIAYVIAYIVVLCCCLRIWLADPSLLYIGRDPDYGIWLAKTYFDWARPLAVTAVNPFQGMGSMLIPMNPYFNPGAWIFETDLAFVNKLVLSMAVYFSEVTVSAFLLGRVLGFSQAFSFASALWLVVLFFPPLNFVFGLQGVLATSPQWGNTLALYNLILILFLLIGRPAWSQRGWPYSSAINVGLASSMTMLLIISLLAAPFYNAGTLPGLILLCAVILLSSSGLAQALWRIAAGLCAIVTFYMLEMFDFFTASKSVTARFAKSGSSEILVPQIHWPIELSRATWRSAQEWLCAAAVVCGRLLFPGALTGAYWLHLAIIGGAVAVWLCMPRPLSRVAGSFALVWMGLLVFWLACALGIVTDVTIGPMYFVLIMYPFWALFSLFSLWVALRWVALRLAAFARTALTRRAFASRATWTSPLALPITIAVGALVLALGYGGYLARGAPSFSYYPQRGGFESRKSPPIVDRLRQEIALRPGDPFRGSVATIFGARGGSLRKALGLPDTSPLAPDQFELFRDKVRAATGNDHDLFDVWRFGIPTVSEYAQGISRQYMFYVANFLSEAGDSTDVSIAFPRVANIDVLRAMGVRFIVIDRVLSDSRATLQLEESIGGAALYLYEIAQPNLGTFSPTKVEVETGFSQLRTSAENNPALLASRAFVSAAIAGSFAPARGARIFFERGGVRVTASSDGTSLLLLPLQFSNCLRARDPHVQVSRADLMFTLVRFEGQLDTRLDWEFDFWRHSQCRVKDVAELRALGLLE
jgi:hypothetical protein